MISIVIPNYNGVEHLKMCYASLKRQTMQDYKVILADNGSSDASADFTIEQFPDSSVIKIGYNSGFAKAVNKGIKKSIQDTESEYILLLNNDIELADNFLETAAAALEANKEASILAVKMMNYYERNKIDDCGDFIKAGGGSPVARGHGETDTGQYEKAEYIFGACAGAAIYRKELFEKIGYFDETFFAYYEDIDFSFRVQLAGLKCYYEPKAVCYHKRGGTSSVATHGFQTEMCERNLVLMRFKNYPLSIYLLYQPLFFAARLNRYFFFIKDHSFAIFLRAVKGYIRGCFKVFTKIPQRIKIQSAAKVNSAYIKSLFIK